MRRFLLCAAGMISLAACGVPVAQRGQTDQQASAQQEDLARRAQDEVGIYQPTHFTRKRLANRIGQMLDDPNLATISYAQGMDGKLRCIGPSIGFPLPAATQTTSPQKWEAPLYFDSDGQPYTYGQYREGELVPQAEPDQLFSPSSEDATWILLVNPKTGKSSPAYFEGKVQAFTTDNKPDPSLIAQDCTS